MAFIYFTSYARLDDNKFSNMSAVLERLETRVRQLRGNVDSLDTRIGFVDVQNIDTGSKWQDAISAAVHSAYVLVCMMSASYFNSVWCAKEFDVFRRRVTALGKAAEAIAIIPVLWDVPRGISIPTALAGYEAANARYPAEYAREGLRTLHALKRYQDAYKLTVEELARCIVAAAAGGLPPLVPPVAVNDLPAAFQNPGRYNLAIATLHDDGPRWLIDAAGASTLANRAELVASRLRLGWRVLAAQPDLPTAVRAAVEQERAAVVIVTDEASASRAPFQSQLAALDASQPPGLALLVASDGDDGVAKALAPTLAASPHRYLLDTFSLQRPGDAVDKLARFGEKLRATLVAEDPASKIADAALQMKAAENGVPITTRPGLTGPGGAS